MLHVRRAPTQVALSSTALSGNEAQRESHDSLIVASHKYSNPRISSRLKKPLRIICLSPSPFDCTRQLLEGASKRMSTPYRDQLYRAET
ncbi:unnamed protein product [Chondrus crispus]|uniref:Uncharacterized protein n=1 Tax=Chondrus crispus TaxID=2769 RepID=R7Q2U5_CHOCR|nr:unnamed protein product [Chondrus crispus]CDF32354.1 unnamed protein product [Chondrus crispus]|eukprot:XP_005712019.1 unnamed protein product [Chondrus crispus]